MFFLLSFLDCSGYGVVSLFVWVCRLYFEAPVGASFFPMLYVQFELLMVFVFFFAEVFPATVVLTTVWCFCIVAGGVVLFVFVIGFV